MKDTLPLSVPTSDEENDAIARIRAGLAQAKRGEGRTIEEVLSELESGDNWG
jgi:predicted transcriptional regulator